jgi:hypothetical protein
MFCENCIPLDSLALWRKSTTEAITTPARIAIIAITTNNSNNVKDFSFLSIKLLFS